PLRNGEALAAVGVSKCVLSRNSHLKEYEKLSIQKSRFEAWWIQYVVVCQLEALVTEPNARSSKSRRQKT
ncbi:MAG: hypothetical protein MUC83_14585, partial [Pirellula sp.]|nr:hypothetical protein [Pirellula sp.]